MKLMCFLEVYNEEERVWQTAHLWLRTPDGWRPQHPVYFEEDPPPSLCAILCSSMSTSLQDTPTTVWPRAAPGVPSTACKETRYACDDESVQVSWISLEELVHVPWHRVVLRDVEGSDLKKIMLEAVGAAQRVDGDLKLIARPLDLWGKEWLDNAMLRLRMMPHDPASMRLFSLLIDEESDLDEE